MQVRGAAINIDLVGELVTIARRSLYKLTADHDFLGGEGVPRKTDNGTPWVSMQIHLTNVLEIDLRVL